MLANPDCVMPEGLKFEGDKRFFTAALDHADHADLIVHGRNSYEDQPNSPKRTRVVLTRNVRALAAHPANPRTILWNPAVASFEAACEHPGVRSGTIASLCGASGVHILTQPAHPFCLSVAPRPLLP